MKKWDRAGSAHSKSAIARAAYVVGTLGHSPPLETTAEGTLERSVRPERAAQRVPPLLWAGAAADPTDRRVSLPIPLGAAVRVPDNVASARTGSARSACSGVPIIGTPVAL